MTHKWMILTDGEGEDDFRGYLKISLAILRPGENPAVSHIYRTLCNTNVPHDFLYLMLATAFYSTLVKGPIHVISLIICRQ